MWFIYALASAVFASIRRANEKKLAHQLNHFTIGWVIQLLSLPVMIVALVTIGTVFNPFHLGTHFWLPTIAVWFGFYPLNSFLYTNAIKHGELSKILPLQSFSPVFALVLAWVLIGEVPSARTCIAVATIVGAVYILNLKGRYLHNPLHIFKNDIANRYMILSLALTALVGVLDKIAIQASEPLYFSVVSTIGAVVILYVSARLHRAHDSVESIKKQLPILTIAGVLFGLTCGTYMLALATGPLAYVSAVRSTSILMGVIIGFVVLKEKITPQKIIALILIVLGCIGLLQ